MPALCGRFGGPRTGDPKGFPAPPLSAQVQRALACTLRSLRRASDGRSAGFPRFAPVGPSSARLCLRSADASAGFGRAIRRVSPFRPCRPKFSARLLAICGHFGGLRVGDPTASAAGCLISCPKVVPFLGTAKPVYRPWALCGLWCRMAAVTRTGSAGHNSAASSK